jgi:hypothetical protein
MRRPYICWGGKMSKFNFILYENTFVTAVFCGFLLPYDIVLGLEASSGQ